MENKFDLATQELLESARSCFVIGAYLEAADFYKAALRRIRDQRGAADLLIADLFEELAAVHAATGKLRKCQSIYKRVRKIRGLFNNK